MSQALREKTLLVENILYIPSSILYIMSTYMSARRAECFYCASSFSHDCHLGVPRKLFLNLAIFRANLMNVLHAISLPNIHRASNRHRHAESLRNNNDAQKEDSAKSFSTSQMKSNSIFSLVFFTVFRHCLVLVQSRPDLDLFHASLL